MIKKKLIRDLIPQKMFEQGIHPISSNISQVEDDDEYSYMLWEKFYEECREFVHNPCIEELVDIVESALCILSDEKGEDVTYQDLEDELIYKKLNKGSFKKRFMMIFEDEH